METEVFCTAEANVQKINRGKDCIKPSEFEANKTLIEKLVQEKNCDIQQTIKKYPEFDNFLDRTLQSKYSNSEKGLISSPTCIFCDDGNELSEHIITTSNH